MKVKRTENGAHPLVAGDREWNAGDVGEMNDADAVVRIEHGFFEEVVEEQAAKEEDPEN